MSEVPLQQLQGEAGIPPRSVWKTTSAFEAEVGLWVKGVGGERERDNRLRALRGTRPLTVGFTWGCDQEQVLGKQPQPRGRQVIRDQLYWG